MLQLHTIHGRHVQTPDLTGVVRQIMGLYGRLLLFGQDSLGDS